MKRFTAVIALILIVGLVSTVYAGSVYTRGEVLTKGNLVMLGAANAAFKTTASSSVPLGVVADVNVRGVATAVIVVNTDDAFIDAAEAITAGEYVSPSSTAGAVVGDASIQSTSFGIAVANSSGGQVKVRFISLDPTFTAAPTTPYYVVTQTTGDLVNDKLHPNSGAPDYNVTHQASDVSDFDTEVGNHADVTAALAHVSANGTSHSMVRYSKFDGTTAPTVNDDVDLGYVAGSFWTDTTNDKNYVCLDNTNGAAVWTETTQATGTDATAVHDNVAGEISAITEKGSPAAGDWLIIEDAGAGNVKKKVNWSSLPSAAGDMGKATYDADVDNDIDIGAGGTGVALADPGADRLLGWDEAPANSFTLFTLGTNLAFSGTSITIADAFLLNTGDAGTGVYDFGGADSFEVVNGTSPTVNANGEIALDTNTDGDLIDDGWLTYYSAKVMYVLAVDSVAGLTNGMVPMYNSTDDKLAFSTPSAAAGGNTTEIQYNDAGVLAGDSLITRSGAGQLTTGTLRILETGGTPTYYTTVYGGDQSGNLSIYLPSDAGTNGQYVTTDGAGNWGYGTPAGSGDTLKAANETLTGNWVNTDFPWADNEVVDNLTIDEPGIASTVTRDAEWDTEAEVQTAWGAVNIILATEIDTKAELEALLSDVADLAQADGDIYTNTHDMGGANLEVPNAAGNVAVSATNNFAIDETNAQPTVYVNQTELAGEVVLSPYLQAGVTFDPGSQYDSATTVFLFPVWPARFPNGFIIDSWEVSCNVNPDVEMDVNLMYADAWIGLANPVTVDVLDTTDGAAAEDTDANINGGAAIPSGKKMYLLFDADPEGTCTEFTFHMLFHIEED
jgi:hypothetical protein